MSESASPRPDPAPHPAAALLAIVDWRVAQSSPVIESRVALGSSLGRAPGLNSVARGELIARIETASDWKLPDDSARRPIRLSR